MYSRVKKAFQPHFCTSSQLFLRLVWDLSRICPPLLRKHLQFNLASRILKGTASDYFCTGIRRGLWLQNTR